MRSDEALQRLIDGNDRFRHDRREHPRQNRAHRAEVASGQQPFAVIFTCADSRIAPEIVFDQGLGDLFVIRTAGHVLDDAAIGSIEYGVAVLGARLVVVMGHQYCGAVSAALQGGSNPGHIAHLVEKIVPAVESVRGQPGDLLGLAVAANAAQVAAQLRVCPPLLDAYHADGQLEVRAAVYHLETGAAIFL